MSDRSICHLVALLPSLTIALAAPSPAWGGLAAEFAVGMDSFSPIGIAGGALDDSASTFAGTQVFSGGNLSFNGSLSGLDTFDGTDRLTLNLTIRNQDTEAHNVILLVSGFDYGIPAPNPMLLETFVEVNGAGAANTVVFRSWLDPTNTPLGRADANSAGLQGPHPLAGPGPLKFTGPPIIVEAIERYSMTMRVNVVIQPGVTVTYTAVSTAATAIPEPSTVAMLLSASIPLACVARWGRRPGSGAPLGDDRTTRIG